MQTFSLLYILLLLLFYVCIPIPVKCSAVVEILLILCSTLDREISSRRTLLTSISFHRQRSSGTLLNGSLLSRNVNAECGQGHSMADGYHSQQHHHHLHRNGTFGTSGISSKDSVRTMSTSFSNKQTKEEFLNRKNSLSEQNNHNVSHTPNLHNDNQATPSAKEPPPETHICICNKKGITSPNAIENHV